MSDIRWFTSDTHFLHKNIVHIGNGRPWDNYEDMTEGLINNWNGVVGKSDLIYHLGDFSFGNKEQTTEILRRLKGRIHIIRGNHDKTLDQVVKSNPELVESYQPYKEIKIDEQRLVLFHFPILSWHQMHKGSWHLHGHCHNNLKFDNGPMMDVGVDACDWRPIEYSEVRERLIDREIKTYDHHAPGED